MRRSHYLSKDPRLTPCHTAAYPSNIPVPKSNGHSSSSAISEVNVDEMKVEDVVAHTRTPTTVKMAPLQNSLGDHEQEENKLVAMLPIVCCL